MMGRPPSHQKCAEIVAAYRKGYTVRQIAQQMGIHKVSVWKALRLAEIFAPYRKTCEVIHHTKPHVASHRPIAEESIADRVARDQAALRAEREMWRIVHKERYGVLPRSVEQMPA